MKETEEDFREAMRFVEAGCYTLRALQDYYTPPYEQKQERQDVYVLTHYSRADYPLIFNGFLASTLWSTEAFGYLAFKCFITSEIGPSTG